MEHSVRLALLPPSVSFPSELKGKIEFDSQRQRLRWRGYMSEEQFQQLSELHRDPHYQRAVKRLFRRCHRLESPLSRRLEIALAILAMTWLAWGLFVLLGILSETQPW